MKNFKIALFILLSVTFMLSSASAETVRANSAAEATSEDNGLIYTLEAKWRRGGRKPITSKLIKHTPKIILIHHTGTPQKNKTIEQKLQGLYRFSVEDKSWGDVPYHFYIDKDGNMMGGRPVAFQPDTNTEFNPKGYLNITIEGDYTQKGGDELSETQRATMRRLITDLKRKYGIRSVMKHNDIAHTECPGRIELE